MPPCTPRTARALRAAILWPPHPAWHGPPACCCSAAGLNLLGQKRCANVVVVSPLSSPLPPPQRSQPAPRACKTSLTSMHCITSCSSALPQYTHTHHVAHVRRCSTVASTCWTTPEGTRTHQRSLLNESPSTKSYCVTVHKSTTKSFSKGCRSPLHQTITSDTAVRNEPEQSPERA